MEYAGQHCKLFWNNGAFIYCWAHPDEVQGLLDQYGEPDEVDYGPFCDCGTEVTGSAPGTDCDRCAAEAAALARYHKK